jgi:hypothetical protein
LLAETSERGRSIPQPTKYTRQPQRVLLSGENRVHAFRTAPPASMVSSEPGMLQAMNDNAPPATSSDAAAPLSIDALYEQLADALRTCWRADLPVGRWLATRWDLLVALRDTHEQSWTQMAERLHALGVRRNHHHVLSGAWLRRHHLSAALYISDAHVRAQLREWGLEGNQADAHAPVQNDWFPVGQLLGGPVRREDGRRTRKDRQRS